MSRQAHLPPRCPFQKRTTTRSIHGACQHIEPSPRHHKSVSQSSILEEQPAWLDDLLMESDTNSKGLLHRRSASDPVTLLDGLVPLPSLSPSNDDENFSLSETVNGLESAGIYGPNSPRRKGKLTFPENAMVSALSEYLSHSPMQYLDDGPCIAEMVHCESRQDAGESTGEANSETKLVKRHSGQRSRIRKLQYIAELERTVDALQTLGSELAVRVSCLLQQRVSLSRENSKLKQQVSRLQQKKMVVDGQHQTLRNEMERLNTCVGYSSNRDDGVDFKSSSAAVNFDGLWHMLDMGKLDLS